jgi:perosamine synthetase
MSELDAFGRIVELVRSIYGQGYIPLHRPVFKGNEKRYLAECIDSNFVSSIGKKVNEFERGIASFLGVKHAIAVANGTVALHAALKIIGVDEKCDVITQALTFVATCNAAAYLGAKPVFVDVDKSTLGMSPEALRDFLSQYCELVNDVPINKASGRRFGACVPMHTFGHPCRIDQIVELCAPYNIPVVEDAAESLGTKYRGSHAGTFGLLATLSFNGNKIITTGGGGMIVTNDDRIAAVAKHITTTAKVAHPYKFMHDEVGYNYRLPNLNAALGCAQLESLQEFIETKRSVAAQYRDFFKGEEMLFVEQPAHAESNFWLNAVLFESQAQRDAFLHLSNSAEIMTRPVWELMSDLPMYSNCQADALTNTRFIAERLVNLPSSVPQ